MIINRTYLFHFLFLMVLIISGQSCKPDISNKNDSTSEVVSQIPQIDNLDQQIANNPNDPVLYFNRAQIYFKNEGYDEAIQDMAYAMQLDSTNIEYHHFLRKL